MDPEYQKKYHYCTTLPQICSVSQSDCLSSSSVYKLLFIAQSPALFERSSRRPWLTVLKILPFHDEIFFYTPLHAISFICLTSDDQSVPEFQIS